MGLAGLILKIAIGLVAAVGAVAGIAYAMDAPVEATVTGTQCAGGTRNPWFPPLGVAGAQRASEPTQAADSTVDVRTQLFGISHTVSVDRSTCLAVRPDNFVVYHIRSGHTILYEDASKTVCIYDSATGVC